MGLFSLRPFPSSVMCTATNGSNRHHSLDALFIKHAAELADKSAGFITPHPNFMCVIVVNSGTMVVGEGYLHAQATHLMSTWNMVTATGGITSVAIRMLAKAKDFRLMSLGKIGKVKLLRLPLLVAMHHG